MAPRHKPTGWVHDRRAGLMNRRRVLASLVTGFSALAIGAFAFPFWRAWLPKNKQALTLDLSLADLKTGEARLIRWLGRNVYIVRRDAAVQSHLTALNPSRQDPDSSRSRQPVYTSNEYRSRRPEHLIVYANCTHLGCEVEIIREAGFRGFRCPCHKSEFDAAGRVAKGATAKFNLEVPEYDYIGQDAIRLLKS